jgi:AraC family transcriptional regulator, positive regulator of tynA and feaB
MRSGGAAVEAYSTASVHKKEKIEYWQHLCSRTYADLRLSPRDHSSFEGELRRSFAGPLSFVNVRSSAACITRTEEHVIDSRGHRFEIFLTRRGESVCDHNGQRAVLRPGDFALVDISLPYRFQFADACSAVSIGMPKSLLGSYLPVPGLYIGRHMPGLLGVNRVASVMIDCLCEQVDSGQVSELSPAVVRGIMDVITAAFASVAGSRVSETVCAASRRVQIRTYIEGHLRDPRLTPRHIATALGISPRYLRLLFSQEDETISRYVTRRRLEEATREVADSTWRGTTITDIAYHWGFGDAARFSRAFREQFGVSPRRYRQTQIKQS